MNINNLAKIIYKCNSCKKFDNENCCKSNKINKIIIEELKAPQTLNELIKSLGFDDSKFSKKNLSDIKNGVGKILINLYDDKKIYHDAKLSQESHVKVVASNGNLFSHYIKSFYTYTDETKFTSEGSYMAKIEFKSFNNDEESVIRQLIRINVN